MNQATADCLSPDEWQQLESLLTSCGDEHAFTALECHGLMCAIAIFPEQIEEQDIYGLIFDGEVDKDQVDFKPLQALINKTTLSVKTSLDQGQKVLPPCPLHIEQPVKEESSEEELLSPIQLWASAFMQGVFLKEEQWFERDEELVAQMSLPILVASDLVESEDIAEIQKDHKLVNLLCKEIPNTLTDMYLFYRVSQ
ncbi:MAG: hypothetical protein COB04_00760 [Gammaproteobacteria bacterium]|nr:MAG: hypothetical protein COB04_00760 [Gammaproteobacteria bacterium]